MIDSQRATLRLSYIKLKGKLLAINDLISTVLTEIGRTETVMDNLNPKFIKALTVEYHFEEKQNFKAKISTQKASQNFQGVS